MLYSKIKTKTKPIMKAIPIIDPNLLNNEGFQKCLCVNGVEAVKLLNNTDDLNPTMGRVYLSTNDDDFPLRRLMREWPQYQELAIA